MEWFTAHPLITGSAVLFLLALLWRGRSIVQWIWQANQTLRTTEKALTDAAERREREAVRQCQEAREEIRGLKEDLKSETRKVLMRDAINKEDREYIRALIQRLREHHIDHSDIVQK